MMLMRKSRTHNSYGVIDYFNFYKSEGGELSDPLYRKVTKRINELIAEAILDGYIYNLPSNLGMVGITKSKTYVKSDKDGNIVTDRPVDWKSTLDMWKEYPETKEKKQLVRHANRHSNGNVYRVKYIKTKANYKNKTLYTMLINRGIKRAITPKIFSGFDVDKIIL